MCGKPKHRQLFQLIFRLYLSKDFIRMIKKDEILIEFVVCVSVNSLFQLFFHFFGGFFQCVISPYIYIYIYIYIYLRNTLRFRNKFRTLIKSSSFQTERK